MDLEQYMRQVSEQDAKLLFEKDLYGYVSSEEQNNIINWLYILHGCRHYNKIGGDFDIIRDPMYKYRKDKKERLFRDKYMAFLWMYYRCQGEVIKHDTIEN